MSLFFPRNRSKAAEAVPDEWTVTEGEHEGSPLILRFNEHAGGSRANFPFRLGLAVPFREPLANGLPGEADQARLNEIEDTLSATLARDGRGVLGVVVTTGGMRESVSYLSDRRHAEPVHRDVEAAGLEYEVQAYGEADPEWSAYEEFRP